MKNFLEYSRFQKSGILLVLLILVTSLYLWQRYREISNEMSDVTLKFNKVFFTNELVGIPKTLGTFSMKLKESLETNIIDDPTLMYSFNQIKNRFKLSILYAMNAKGDVLISTDYLGNKGNKESLTGNNYKFREYFTEAIKGKEVIFPALGVTTLKRGLYYSAPVFALDETFISQYEGEDPKQNIIGVVVVKQGMENIDEHIKKFIPEDQKSILMLLTPDGFVFSSNKDEYLFKRATKANRDLSKEELLKQYGSAEKTPFDLVNRLSPFMLWYNATPYFTYEEKINIYDENNPWTLSLLHPIFNLYEITLLSFLWILTCLLFYFYYAYAHNKMEKMLVLQKNKEQGDTIHGQQHLIENIFESLSYPFYVVSVESGKLLMENLKARNTNWYQENKGSLIPVSDVVHARRSLIQERKVDDCYFEVHAYPVFNDVGEIDKVIEYAHDVTERKFMEKEKDHMMKQLYQSTKLASIGELAAGVAHEINNPLAIIKGYIDLTQKTLEKANFINPTIDDSIRKIKDSVDRIAKIVLGLRTYARMDNEDEAKKIDVMQVINQSISLVEVVFKKCSVSFEVKNGREGMAFIMATEGKLQQVFMNIFSNAKDAITETGEEGIIEILCETNENTVKISIKDNGIGIKKEVQSRIFETFFTTKPVGKGTGLGMSISQSIIDSFHGKMSFESEENIGTTIFLEFPKA